jgi:hypothetical protein
MSLRLHSLLRILLVALAAAAIAPSVAAAAVVVGISDDSPAFFSDPRFLSLGVHESRYVVPWNTAVTRNGRWRAQTAVWLAAAARANVTPLISFAGTGNDVPTVASYTAAVRKFIAEFPTVKRYTAWNEPDWIYRPAIADHPRLAAAYDNALSAACRGCLVVAGDLYLPAAQLGLWVRQYAAALHHRPTVWALHDYYDIRDHTTAQLQALLRYTTGQIWLDETGGVENRGHWTPVSPAKAAVDERYLFSLAARFPRISRIYHYQWRVTMRNSWDSALVGFDNRLRPAYNVIAHMTRPPYAL